MYETRLCRTFGTQLQVVRFDRMEAFIKRVRQYSTVADEIWGALDELPVKKQIFHPDETVIHTGDVPSSLFVIDRGWAMRYRLLEDGRRQIVNFMLPGDMFDLQSLADLEADHNVTAITELELSSIEQRSFVQMLQSNAELASAFWWAAVQEESILREQIVRIGRRSARERIGHLLLELRRRYLAATGETGKTFEFPLTRAHLADALGLTVVHVSRTMSALKRSQLVEETGSRIRINDLRKLRRLSQFDDQYLHNRNLDFSRFLHSAADSDLSA